VLAIAASQLDDVAEAAGGDQSRGGAAVLEHRVGDGGGPQHDHIGLPEEIWQLELVRVGGVVQPLGNADRPIPGGPRGFGLEHLPRGVSDHQIGERAPDVDANLKRHALYGLLSLAPTWRDPAPAHATYNRSEMSSIGQEPVEEARHVLASLPNQPV